jgi:pimeloyl-ACP methyl ester carboxylesterase
VSRVVSVLVELSLVTFGLTALGLVFYVVSTFWLMRAHVPRRSGWVAAREALRELFWSAVTQPLIPLFYLIGRRMGRPRRADGGRPAIPVIFVHGYFQNRADFVRMALTLSRRGLGPLYGFNYPWTASIRANAGRLGRFIDAVCRECGVEEVDLVCHSLGGLVALEYLNATESVPGAGRVRRCVTIGTPHAGVAWRGPLFGACGAEIRAGGEYLRACSGRMVTVPCLSIYSTHDNIVYPSATSGLTHKGGQDWVVRDLGHLAILFAPEVVRTVADFLTCVSPPGVDRVSGARVSLPLSQMPNGPGSGHDTNKAPEVGYPRSAS